MISEEVRSIPEILFASILLMVSTRTPTRERYGYLIKQFHPFISYNLNISLGYELINLDL